MRRIARRAGRRGAFLAFLAILDTAYGYSLLATDAPQRLINLFAPWEAWAYAWMAAGVLCVAGVFARRGDRLPFTIQAALFTAWGAVMADAWIIQGVARGWVSAVVFLSFAAAVQQRQGGHRALPVPGAW